MAFYSIQLHFIRDICAKVANPNSPQPQDVGQNSDEGISVSEFLVNPLQMKIFITPEPVMILT